MRFGQGRDASGSVGRWGGGDGGGLHGEARAEEGHVCVWLLIGSVRAAMLRGLAAEALHAQLLPAAAAAAAWLLFGCCVVF